MNKLNTYSIVTHVACAIVLTSTLMACNDDQSSRGGISKGEADAASPQADVADEKARDVESPRDTSRSDIARHDGEEGAESDSEVSTDPRDETSDVASTDTSSLDGASRDTERMDIERRDTSMSSDGGSADGETPDATDTRDATSRNDGGSRDGASRDTTTDTSSKSCDSPKAKACTSDEWCDFPGNDCGKTDSGTCRQRPRACPNGGDPVCGCDDQTYANECIAHSKGVDIQYKGRCRPQSGACDGQTCSKKEYCAYPKGTCGQNASGTCELKPTGCPTTYDPVCGCDGQTYSNKCKARANGVNVESDGTCQPKPGACGGQTCSKKEYCAYPKGTCGRGASGTCKSKPSGFCPGVYKPVCGCNGKTYNNKCRARSNGVNIKSDGKC